MMQSFTSPVVKECSASQCLSPASCCKKQGEDTVTHCLSLLSFHYFQGAVCVCMCASVFRKVSIMYLESSRSRYLYTSVYPVNKIK